MIYLKSMGGIEVALIFLFTFDFRMILNADVYVTLKSYNIFLFGYKSRYLYVSILLSPLSLLSTRLEKCINSCQKCLFLCHGTFRHINGTVRYGAV